MIDHYVAFEFPPLSGCDNGPYTFCLNGHNHHRIRTLLPTHADGLPRFAQLYIYDTENEVDNQIHALNLTIADNNSRLLLQYLIAMLNLNNPLVQSFCMARERFNGSSMQPVTLCLLGTRQRNAREYNLPTTYEVAALVPGNSNPMECHDVIVEEHHTDDGHNPVKHWYKRDQNTIRFELYHRLHDRISSGETNIQSLGRNFILPSTFTGGPRHMIQQYQDAMAICRWAGPPNLFETMTCNRKWPEIERDVKNYIPGLPATDRPNTITRVFKMKLDNLTEDIQKGHHFGRVKADDKISSTDEIDHVISAELPFEVDDPIGFEAVRTHMMHGLCGDQFRSSPNHAKLFRDTFPYISEDITHKNRRLLNNQQLVFTNREIQNYTLLELETILNGNNKSLLDFPQLPQIDYSLMNIERNRLIATERMDNMHEEWAWFTTLYGGLNSEQRVVYDNIMLVVNENNGGLFLCAGVEIRVKMKVLALKGMSMEMKVLLLKIEEV
ncbi:putative PIF1 DNA helicase/replication protein A1-like protein [Tanacetum coccineum]